MEDDKQMFFLFLFRLVSVYEYLIYVLIIRFADICDHIIR